MIGFTSGVKPEDEDRLRMRRELDRRCARSESGRVLVADQAAVMVALIHLGRLDYEDAAKRSSKAMESEAEPPVSRSLGTVWKPLACIGSDDSPAEKPPARARHSQKSSPFPCGLTMDPMFQNQCTLCQAADLSLADCNEHVCSNHFRL